MEAARRRCRFDKKYWATYKVLDILQKVFYRSNPAREAFVEMCESDYVQKMTFDSYLYKTVCLASLVSVDVSSSIASALMVVHFLLNRQRYGIKGVRCVLECSFCLRLFDSWSDAIDNVLLHVIKLNVLNKRSKRPV